MDKKYNLVFIFADQHRKFDIGCYGNSEVITPNLDKLASEGVRFENCCSNSPVCVPARGSLLTGLYAQNHGAFTNDLEIRYDVESIADVLIENGYHTGYIGKWHLCGVPREQFVEKGKRLGFEEWKVANCNHDYRNCYYDDEENVRHFEEGYEPEIFGGLACDFLERNCEEEKPFALFLSFATPHDPHDTASKEYCDLYRDRKVTLRPNSEDKVMEKIGKYLSKAEQTELSKGYYAHISAIDKQVGKILDVLSSKGKKSETLVIYTSDHGDMLGSHGLKDKQQPYEEAIGVPLIMSLPGVIKRSVTKELIGLVDLPVTVAGLLGMKFKNKTDGIDLKDVVLSGGKGLDECYLYDLFPCHQAIDKGMRAWRAIKTQKYTYSVYGNGKERFLFDNEKDPYQMNNLIDDKTCSQVKNKLSSILSGYVKKYDGFTEGEEYIRFTGRTDDFNKSQLYFGREELKTNE